MSIERFELTCLDADPDVVPVNGGQWVRYADHAAEVERLEREKAELRETGYNILQSAAADEARIAELERALQDARKFIASFDGKMPTASEDEGVFALLERIDEALSHEGERKG